VVLLKLAVAERLHSQSVAVIIDDEDKVSLSLLQFPLCAPDQMSKNYDF